MATANPRFSPWIPVVSVNCINPFSSCFFSLWEYVKRLLWFLVIRNYVHWWHGFPTWKHDIHIHRLALQTIVLLLLLTQRLRRHIAMLSCSNTLPSLLLCIVLQMTRKTLWNLDWDASVEIQLESHFKLPPNVAWIDKITFHVVFFVFALQTV